jgi:uncharacterized protein
MPEPISDRQCLYLNLDFGVIGHTVISRDGAIAPGRIELWETNGQNVVDGEQIVAIPYAGEVTFARVLYGDVINDCRDPIIDVVPSEEDAAAVQPMTARPTVGRWQLAALRNTGDTTRPVGAAEVYYPSPAGLEFALGMERIPQCRRIPAGLFRNGDGLLHPVAFDVEYLLGPETIHMDISGQTGLATKSSYAWFILSAIMQSRATLDRSIAVIVFNTKGSDLLFADLPNDPRHPFWQEHTDLVPLLQPNMMLSDGDEMSDINLYDTLGMDTAPFDQVTLFIPRDDVGSFHGYRIPVVADDGQATNPLGIANLVGFNLGLRDFIDSLALFQSRADRDEKIMAVEADLLRAVENGYWVNDEAGRPVHQQLRNFDDLLEHFEEAVLSRGDHHRATVSRAFRRYAAMASRASRVVSRWRTGYERDGLRVRDMADGDLWIVDLGRLQGSAEEMLVVHTLLRDLLRAKRSGAMAVDDVIVVLDELNKYAPAQGRSEGENAAPIRRALEELAQRARSDRITLLAAQQSLAQVTDAVAENLVTRAFGVMSAKEAAKPDYGLDTAAQYAVARLQKGELLLQHPIFPAPVRVRFPRPVVLPGKLGQGLLPTVTGQDRVTRLARLMAGRDGRAMPEVDALTALLAEIGETYDVPESLLERVARRVGAIAPQEHNNVPRATLNLFRRILSQTLGEGEE